MKTRFVLLTLLSLTVLTASAQMFTSLDEMDVTFQSQQFIQPVSNYSGMTYTPFGASMPYDQSGISNNQEETSAPHGPRRLGGGTDPGEPSEQYPIGDPWILLIMATALAGGIYARRKKIDD